MDQALQRNKMLKRKVWENYEYYKAELNRIEIINQTLLDQIDQIRKQREDTVKQYSNQICLLNKELQKINHDCDEFRSQEIAHKQFQSIYTNHISMLEEESDEIIRKANEIFGKDTI